MASPFPGTDPYLEAPVSWPGVHTSVIGVIRELLAEQVAPRYFVDVERRLYVIDEDDEAQRHFIPDAVVFRSGAQGTLQVATEAKPATAILLTMTEPVEVREPRLVIRQVGGERAVVTAIEVLSPANKTPGSRGREEYVAERREVLHSQANLVEIDLLRAGLRPPSFEPWPVGDYLVHVSRAKRRPRGEAWVWTLRDPLPEIPIPLGEGDRDAILDLGRAVRETYTRARYDLAIDYAAPPPEPPLSPEDAAWAAELVRKR